VRFFSSLTRRPPLPRDSVVALQVSKGRPRIAERRSTIRNTLRPRIVGMLVFPRMPRMM
jgi:hypothetical protein